MAVPRPPKQAKLPARQPERSLHQNVILPGAPALPKDSKSSNKPSPSVPNVVKKIGLAVCPCPAGAPAPSEALLMQIPLYQLIVLALPDAPALPNDPESSKKPLPSVPKGVKKINPAYQKRRLRGFGRRSQSLREPSFCEFPYPSRLSLPFQMLLHCQMIRNR